MSLSCLQFRQLVGAVPSSRDPAVLEHRLHCRACAAFAEEQLAFDHRLEAALRIPVPEDLKARVIWNQTGRWQTLRSRRWSRTIGLAAGFVLVIALVIGSQFTGRDSFENDVIVHIGHEPNRLVWPINTPAARPVQVSAVLDSGGVSLAEPLNDVMSAGLCPFRGHQVPHLVMRVNGEAVSVLLLPDEPVREMREFHEAGYHGMLLPHNGGGIAIVAPRPELVRPTREQLEKNVSWRL